MSTITSRALRAAPLVGLALIMIRAAIFAEPMADLIAGMQRCGHFSMRGVKVPIIATFYKVPILDTALSHITIAFAQLQMYPADPGAYWQSLVFLTEYGSLYAILFWESCRMGYHMRLRYPIFITFIAQFIPVGIMVPLYLFCLYVFSPPQRFALPINRTIWPAQAAGTLPTIILAYYVPHFLSYFHQSYAARHWWNWIWQLYPIWGSLTFLTSIILAAKTIGYQGGSSKHIVRVSVGVLAAVNTAIYWYTAYSSELSLFQLFVPKYFIYAPVEADVALRVVIQYDYICCLGAALLWLALMLRDLKDMKDCGSMQLSWTMILVSAVVLSGTCGVGTMMLVAWSWRNELLITPFETKELETRKNQ